MQNAFAHKTSKKGRYEFRGATIISDEWTITQLNRALAMNRQQDRYKKVTSKKNGK